MKLLRKLGTLLLVASFVGIMLYLVWPSPRQSKHIPPRSSAGRS
jgi:hypothetical protein